MHTRSFDAGIVGTTVDLLHNEPCACAEDTPQDLVRGSQSTSTLVFTRKQMTKAARTKAKMLSRLDDYSEGQNEEVKVRQESGDRGTMTDEQM